MDLYHQQLSNYIGSYEKWDAAQASSLWMKRHIQMPVLSNPMIPHEKKLQMQLNLHFHSAQTFSNSIFKVKWSVSAAFQLIDRLLMHLVGKPLVWEAETSTVTAFDTQMLWYCKIGNSCGPAAIHGVVVLRNQAKAQFPSRTRDLTNMAAQSGWLQLCGSFSNQIHLVP